MVHLSQFEGLSSGLTSVPRPVVDNTGRPMADGGSGIVRPRPAGESELPIAVGVHRPRRMWVENIHIVGNQPGRTPSGTQSNEDCESGAQVETSTIPISTSNRKPSGWVCSGVWLTSHAIARSGHRPQLGLPARSGPGVVAVSLMPSISKMTAAKRSHSWSPDLRLSYR